MTITWKHIIISFIFGIIIGITITWLKKHEHVIKKTNKQTNQNNEKEKLLIDHFINIANLLNNITNQHYKLYDHIKKDNQLNLSNNKQNKIFIKNELKTDDNNKKERKKQPKDYPETINK